MSSLILILDMKGNSESLRQLLTVFSAPRVLNFNEINDSEFIRAFFVNLSGPFWMRSLFRVVTVSVTLK